MKSIEIVKNLIEFSPRQFEREEMTKKYIIEILKKNDISFKLQNFHVAVPIFKNYYLKADGREIECLPTCFKSGKISKKCDIISSLDFSYKGSGNRNINYNPHCDGISLANFYDEPSLAISRKDIKIIRNAKKIDGMVEVEKKTYESCNILAGNCKDPKNIIFAHYDCFFKGALDNASGVAVCLDMIIENKNISEDDLIVFCGAEELSFDQPEYWGKCFRVFEDKYELIMKRANKIIIADCVGNGIPEIVINTKVIPLYFPAKALKSMNEKIYVVTSAEREPEKLMSVYHCNFDNIENVDEKYLIRAKKVLLKICK